MFVFYLFIVIIIDHVVIQYDISEQDKKLFQLDKNGVESVEAALHLDIEIAKENAFTAVSYISKKKTCWPHYSTWH